MSTPKQLLAVALSCILAGPAVAKTVVLPPLLTSNGDGKAVDNVTSLISSELSFMADVDDVKELKSAPGLSMSCLNSTSCLAGVAKGGDELVTGNLTVGGGQYQLDLVLYDAGAGKIVRRKTFSVPSTPEGAADAMNGVVHELMTGVNPKAKTTAEPTPTNFKPSDDDISFDKPAAKPAAKAPAPVAATKPAAKPASAEDIDPDDIDLGPIGASAPAGPTAQQQAAAKAAADAAARKKADDDARAAAQAAAARQAQEEAQRQAEEAARQKAAAEDAARQKAAADAAAKAAAAKQAQAKASDDDFDPNAISFGSAAGQMKSEDLTPASRPAPAPVAAAAPAPKPAARSYYNDDEETADIDDAPARAPARTSAPASTTRSSTTLQRPADTTKPQPIQLAVRVGYSKYFSFNFVSFGGEASVAVVPSVLLLAGVDSWTVHRQVPPALQAKLGLIAEWNTLVPFNFGIVYRMPNKTVRPYLGADGIACQYYKSPTGHASWAFGGRGRAGLDIMAIPNFGFNLNVAIGAWQGAQWGLIDTGIGTSGLLVEASAGPVIAF